MITREMVATARSIADYLWKCGDYERARALDELADAAAQVVIPTMDLLTTAEAGELLGVSAETIEDWVSRGGILGFRAGIRVMVPRDPLVAYVRRARTSLDLEEIGDEEATQLVAEGRSHNARTRPDANSPE